MSLATELFRCVPAVSSDPNIADTPKHLGWLMLTGLGIGATIGAGIFAMPGIIAGKAGPAGVLSFIITGLVILIVAICYERFSMRMPEGVSAYSYVYHSMGELVAWIVAFGLFMEYSFGASAVAIAWSVYLETALGVDIPAYLMGPSFKDGVFVPGINVVAIGVVSLITVILIFGGVSKSAKLNFALVLLKMILLVVFLVVGISHVNPANWIPFMPRGFEGVLQGAAVAVFPYVGFDALYTFARESKSQKDTKIGTYLTVGVVAALYIAVMAVATGLAPCFIDGQKNELFVGSEAAAPLAKLLVSVGETWSAQVIAFGAVLGIFNVLLVLCMGGPRIFRNMSEDGLLPPVFQKVKHGNPTIGILLNGILVALIAGFMDFTDIADMMVLGTLVAFTFVCLGALRLKLVNPILTIVGAICCVVLACHLNEIVLKAYAITCPVGLLIYAIYGFRHSKLRSLKDAQLPDSGPESKPDSEGNGSK
ncbi:MAG: amino acid permease [Candidatus Obscuribacterales bacterium]|nr:amino acid permease [Candidatus Obscuribacterales bacterium]